METEVQPKHPKVRRLPDALGCAEGAGGEQHLGEVGQLPSQTSGTNLSESRASHQLSQSACSKLLEGGGAEIHVCDKRPLETVSVREEGWHGGL